MTVRLSEMRINDTRAFLTACYFCSDKKLVGLIHTAPSLRIRLEIFPALLHLAHVVFFLSSYASVTFRPNPFASKYSLFFPPASCNMAAIFLAFSILLRSTYDLDFLMASPISSAERASPCARTTVACFSWRALSTTKAARWASCWATCLASTAAVNSGEKARC